MASSPVFLEFEDVIAIHHDQLEHYGGSPGVRDEGLLSSALAMPRSQFNGEFAHPTIFEMAGAYLFHVVNNHPFIDGNKRTGTAAALVFLLLNGYELIVPEEDLEKTVLKVASSAMSKTEVSHYIKENTIKLD